MWTNDLVRICKHGEPDMKGIIVDQGVAAGDGATAYKVKVYFPEVTGYGEVLFYMMNAIGTKRHYSVENKEVWMENL